MKTSNLSGNALCYAVCMIEMPHLVWGETIGIHHASNQIVVPELPEPQCYSPFSDWDMCGSIIEREKIEITRGNPLYFPQGNESGDYYEPLWIAGKQQGQTALIAAMRCYVANKLGDEVDIPEELTC